MNKGWKPLPVILKIIFVILVFRAFYSVFSLSPSFDKGFDFFGFTLFGLYAINTIFIFKTVLPIIILIGMFYRYQHIWIVAAIYFFVFALGMLFTIGIADNMLERIIEQVPELFKVPAGVSEDYYLGLVNAALVISILFSASFELAMMIIFIVKRKYFTEFDPEKISSPENNLPS